MDRRRFLAALGAGSLAGCVNLAGDRASDDAASAPTATPHSDPAGARRTRTPVETIPLARHGVPQSICSEPKSDDPGIYAVTDPAFADDWSDVDVGERYRVDFVRDEPGESGGAETVTGTRSARAGGLAPDQTVIGLAGEGRARAYPLSVLTYHEIVNDPAEPTSEGARPVAVTYCPLCKSALVADPVVDGVAREFLVSGLLWRAPGVPAEAAKATGDVFGAGISGGTPEVRNNGNLVMYDRGTGSYWSQILAQAICGELRGTKLDIVPAGVLTWERWRRDHPDTDVLLPPPYSGTHSP
jgi:hypothetical protein